jgi:hypothetical protein
MITKPYLLALAICLISSMFGLHFVAERLQGLSFGSFTRKEASLIRFSDSIQSNYQSKRLFQDLKKAIPASLPTGCSSDSIQIITALLYFPLVKEETKISTIVQAWLGDYKLLITDWFTSDINTDVKFDTQVLASMGVYKHLLQEAITRYESPEGVANGAPFWGSYGTFYVNRFKAIKHLCEVFFWKMKYASRQDISLKQNSQQHFIRNEIKNLRIEFEMNETAFK